MKKIAILLGVSAIGVWCRRVKVRSLRQEGWTGSNRRTGRGTPRRRRSTGRRAALADAPIVMDTALVRPITVTKGLTSREQRFCRTAGFS
jgi:hypothetical protein